MKLPKILFYILAMCFSFGCKKDISKHSDSVTDSLTRCWRIISSGEKIIDKACNTAISKNTVIDYSSIVDQIQNIENVIEAEVDGSAIKVRVSDGSTLSLMTLTRNDGKLFPPPSSTFKIGDNPNVSNIPLSITTSMTYPANKKALILLPFQKETNENENALILKLEYAGYSVDAFANESVSISHFTGDYLAQYGFVYISTHGLGDDSFQNEKHPSIVTGVSVDKTKFDNLPPIQQKYITQNSVRGSNIVYFTVTDKFIEKTLTKKFPNSWVFINACESAKNDLFSNVFLKNGAMAFSGNIRNVDGYLANTLGAEMVSFLTGGYDFAQANNLLEYHQGLSDMIIGKDKKLLIYSLAYKTRTKDPFTLTNTNGVYLYLDKTFGPNLTAYNLKIIFSNRSIYDNSKVTWMSGDFGKAYSSGYYLPRISYNDAGSYIIGSINEYVDMRNSVFFSEQRPYGSTFSFKFEDKQGNRLGSASIPFSVLEN